MKKIRPSYPEPEVFQAVWPDELPGWEERFGFYAIGHDGTVFLPAIAVDQPDKVLHCATFDGEPLFVVGGDTPLFRSEWLKENYPRKTAQIDFVVARIRSPEWQAKLK
jgi:hypothetical protein